MLSAQRDAMTSLPMFFAPSRMRERCTVRMRRGWRCGRLAGKGTRQGCIEARSMPYDPREKKRPRLPQTNRKLLPTETKSVERTCKPNFVPAALACNRRGSFVCRSRYRGGRATYPDARVDTGGSIASLFGLAPQGVCHAVDTHVRRGALLPHRFTLTSTRGGYEPTPRFDRRFVLCCTFRRVAAPGR